MNKFAFGKNWQSFLNSLHRADKTDARVQMAEDSLAALLGPKRDDRLGANAALLEGMKFLDAGSGSGLFSLAAYRLGATVVSFDADEASVECTTAVRDQFSAQWQITAGSLLDSKFMNSLGQFDVVYCWGVAHHTGNQWLAMEHLAQAVTAEGRLVIAIYNDEQFVSKGWLVIKRIYRQLPGPVRPLWVLAVAAYAFLKRLVGTLAAVLFRMMTLRNPLIPIRNWMREPRARGMHWWYDWVDWVGGWPYEVARPEQVFEFFHERGFELRKLTTADGHGCNEFVFERRGGAEMKGSR